MSNDSDNKNNKGGDPWEELMSKGFKHPSGAVVLPPVIVDLEELKRKDEKYRAKKAKAQAASKVRELPSARSISVIELLTDMPDPVLEDDNYLHSGGVGVQLDDEKAKLISAYFKRHDCKLSHKQILAAVYGEKPSPAGSDARKEADNKVLKLMEETSRLMNSAFKKRYVAINWIIHDRKENSWLLLEADDSRILSDDDAPAYEDYQDL